MSRHLAVRSFTRETLERGHMSCLLADPPKGRLSRKSGASFTRETHPTTDCFPGAHLASQTDAAGSARMPSNCGPLNYADQHVNFHTKGHCMQM
jgi:hypothetical protein